MLSTLNKLEEIDSRWNELIPFFLDFYETVNDTTEKTIISREIKEFYFKNHSLSDDTAQQFIKVILE